LAGWSIVDALLNDEVNSKIARTEVAQPANFLLQIALAAELATLGVHPAAIVGHSVGEVSAAYLSGMLSLQDAVRVSYHRSRLQGRMAGTGMLAVGMSEAAARERLQGKAGVEIAAINSPAGVTLAGNTIQLLDLAEALNQEQVFNRMLRVEVPYHSFLMEPILEELATVLADIQPRPPSVPLYSTVTGRQVGRENLWDASYWVSNVRQPVYFADAVTSLLEDGYQAFLELGPHPTLSSNVLQVIASKGKTGRCVPTLRREQPDAASIRQALADLYNMGALDEAQPPGGVTGAIGQQDLPRHQFQRVHLWSEETLMCRDRLGEIDKKVLPGFRTESSQPEWECDLSVGALPWLHEHVVAGTTLLPGAAYLDAALAAAAQLQGVEQVVLEDVAFISPLVIAPHEAPILRLSVDEGSGRFLHPQPQ
jgi:acyl transferase domain-containing protein